MNLICGINPVIEALSAGTRHFDRLLVVKGLRNKRLSEAIRRATRQGIPLRFEMRETLDRLAGGVPHQGLIAVVSAKPVLSLEHILEAVCDPALLVALDGVEDPRNLGAILRSVESAGADGVLLPERHSAGLSEVVGRTSAGALEHVQVARVGNLVQAIETLKARGVWVVGFDAAGTERWDAVDLNRPVCLVLGGEGRGIRRLVREHCDHLVSIPQFGHVSSLNVSVAAGIALYEAVRQRGTVPSAVRPIPAAASTETRVVGPSPDDLESDPGAAPVVVLAEGLDDGGADGDELAPEILSSHVDIHGEDVAWGQGPTVLKPVASRRGRRPMDRRRRPGGRRSSPEEGSTRRESRGRDGQAREARTGETPSGGGGREGAADTPEAKASEGTSGKRGRRRRRKRPGGARPGGSGPKAGAPRRTTDAEASTAPSRSSADGADSKSGEGDTGAPPARRRRGRRRRR
jgi:23S rRNA (guanosine2251-2'-O)-methyltransferase